MFKALVLMCVIETGICQEFEDIWGPYHTEKECKERSHQMANDIGSIFKDLNVEFKWKCDYEQSI
jgi:hypothetical protein